mmetsp:Transcript_19703/g.42592  ORF Transcript_19703/g.42592 Transcript_19703/m.42592 type:complete len:89 (+) Transcript_19703:295-561(+)
MPHRENMLLILGLSQQSPKEPPCFLVLVCAVAQEARHVDISEYGRGTRSGCECGAIVSRHSVVFSPSPSCGNNTDEPDTTDKRHRLPP